MARGGADKVHTRKGVLDGEFYPRGFRRKDVTNIQSLRGGQYAITLRGGRVIIRTLSELQRAK